MDKDAKIFVAGHRGLVGSAIVRALEAMGYRNLLLRGHAELDLTNQAATERFFSKEKPEYVFLAAAKVGGIHANSTFPADFIRENLLIQNCVIDSAQRFGVKRLLFLGSSCIYPRNCPQPIREEYLLTGALEPTNRPYALAKISGIEMCWAYNRQYGAGFLAVMPTNLYGPGDNYHPENSHVIPGLIRRFHEAKISGHDEVVIWGTGTPRREFLYSEDMANACVFLMNTSDSVFSAMLGRERPDGLPPVINIGIGLDVSIRELAEIVRNVVGYEGKLVFDTSKPDGTPRKILNCDRLTSLGWRAKTDLLTGLRKTYENFVSTMAKKC